MIFDGGITFVTTYGQTTPNPFAILVGSVRWGVTRSEYIIKTNAFLDDVLSNYVYDRFDIGRAEGSEEFDEANATANALEGFDKRILARLTSSFEDSAWFAYQEDAILWSTRESGLQNCDGDVEYKSLEEGNTFILRLIKFAAKNGGPALDGI